MGMAGTLLSSLSDLLLTVLAPVPAYWLTAGFFCPGSSATASTTPQRSRRAIVRFARIIQQVIQTTMLAIVWVSEPPALEVLRFIEILGIEQGWKWGVCT